MEVHFEAGLLRDPELNSIAPVTSSDSDKSELYREAVEAGLLRDPVGALSQINPFGCSIQTIFYLEK